MSLRVWVEKIMFIIHIRSMDEGSLARRVYEEQKNKNWPGLASENALFCQKLNIEDCNVTNITKTLYRKTVVQACHKKNKLNLRKQAKGKCSRIVDELYGK